MGTSEKPAILHILVVGFHHKLGCQVEFSYPPLVAGTTGKQECPSGWKYLSTLALPDGSHRFTKDTVFFNLPSLVEPTESVYGVSCYRQIPVEQLKTRTADVTRSTVQKSVCMLVVYPIYGYIEVKLSLIADAFFEQGDFAHTELLVKAYQQLNACLSDDEVCRGPLRHYHVGLSLRNVVLQWRHKTLILLKLFLLQRRVICFGSPVRGMCALILGVASLIPRLLEKGFQEVACVRTSRPLSPMPDFTDCIQREADDMRQHEQQFQSEESPKSSPTKMKPSPLSEEGRDDDSLLESHSEAASACTVTASTHGLNRSVSAQEDATCSAADMEKPCMERSNSLTREASVDTLASTLSTLAAVNPDEYRAPISIFASGNLCLPYLSLPYMDLLADTSVLSYVIGTSNVLFQQKRQLADVLVDIENGNMDVHDPELRRQLTLSTEDLRYMDFVMRHVQSPKEDAEGSEHWIRDQFRGYILALLRTSVANDATAKDIEHFNTHFMQAFKRTQCFQEWYDVRPDMDFFDALPAGHPFAGTLSVADMKLKIAQTMQNSESGRKLNQAVNNTSRAVGGAISQAKGAFTNWWSSITTVTNAGGPTTGQAVQSTEGATNGARSHAQNLSVAFQVNKHADEMDDGVNIQISQSTDEAAGDGLGKMLDSAEEIVEQNVASNEQEVQGVIEIGHEAEVLDKTTPTIAQQHQQQQQQQLGNGDVFIV